MSSCIIAVSVGLSSTLSEVAKLYMQHAISNLFALILHPAVAHRLLYPLQMKHPSGWSNTNTQQKTHTIVFAIPCTV